MGKKLYVGNLPFSVTDSHLESMFSQVGKVESAKVITDRRTGRSKGFGFVEMTSDEEAAEGINKLNGSEHDGRKITVNEARPLAPRENRGGESRFSSGGGGGGRHRSNRFGGGNRDRGDY